MSFKTPNSSFIFDLRLRSMTEWAVFLAIFFPAALVELGCFLPVTFAVMDDPVVPFLPLPLEVGRAAGMALGSSAVFDFGFIWIILRERVGGGGKEKSGFADVD